MLCLAAHCVMCYPAATCRGDPPIGTFWRTGALATGLVGFVVYPFFDDRITTRRVIRVLYVPLVCLALCVAFANLSDARPHVGHWAGVVGVVKYRLSYVVFGALVWCCLAFPLAWAFEYWATLRWAAVRKFREPPEGLFQCSISAILVLQALVAVLIVLILVVREIWPL